MNSTLAIIKVLEWNKVVKYFRNNSANQVTINIHRQGRACWSLKAIAVQAWWNEQELDSQIKQALYFILNISNEIHDKGLDLS